MNKKCYFIGIFLFIWTFSSSAFEYKNVKFDYDIYGLMSYYDQNPDYIFDLQDFNDSFSFLEGKLTARGGGFGEEQFEMTLKYQVDLSYPNEHYFSLGQMYVNLPITTFNILTFGKKREEFGVASFHNFSNRLSPKEIVNNRTERAIPGMLKYSSILFSDFTCEFFLWFNDSQQWNESNIGMQFEKTSEHFYFDAHFYYEKMENFMFGFNNIIQFSDLKFTTEGIIKDKREQLAITAPEQSKDTWEISVSQGMKFSIGDFSFNLEGAYRSEGYDNTEKVAFADSVRSNNAYINYYNQDYFSKYYGGVGFGISNFIKNDLSLNINNLTSFEYIGGYLSVGLNYLHKEKVNVALTNYFYYGEKNNEYRLFSSTRNKLYLSFYTVF